MAVRLPRLRRSRPEPRRIPESPDARRYRRQRRRTERRQRWQARRAKLRAPILPVAGLAALDAAAWTVHLTAGLAAVGLSLLLLEWLTRPAGPA